VQGADDSYGKTEDSVLKLLVLSSGDAIGTASRSGPQTRNLARGSEPLFVEANVPGSNVLRLLVLYLGVITGRFLQSKFPGGAA
jgi:hypothetical protein